MNDTPSGPELTLADALETVQQLLVRQQADKAELLLKRILEQVPEQPDALNWLSIIYGHGDRLEEALELSERAAVAAPHHAGIAVNRGNILMDLGEDAEAAQSYVHALKLDSGHVHALNNLGVMMHLSNQLDGAVKMLQHAVKVQPKFGLGHYNLSRALGSAGHYSDAIVHARRAVELLPRGAMSIYLLATSYERDNDRDSAIGVVKEWLRETPDDEEVKHILAALEGYEVPDRASDIYVQSLFDRFARSFDAKLAKLGYRAPEVIAKLISELGIGQGGGLRVLDAGCGTGLCGPLIRHYASRFVGIDLSAGMLQRAKRTGAYDQLRQAELSGYLLAATETFDLIISADTLCYFGALEDVASGAARSLAEGGWLIFTVEMADEDGPPYRLATTARYTHTSRYLREVLEHAELEIRRLETETLRLELHEPVRGYVVAARKR